MLRSWRHLFANAVSARLALLCMFGVLPIQMTVRQIKYLNNIIEQDHRFVQKSPHSMRGFKAFHSAEPAEEPKLLANIYFSITDAA